MGLLASSLTILLLNRYQTAPKQIILAPEVPPTVAQVGKVRASLAGSGVDGLVVQMPSDAGEKAGTFSNVLAKGDAWTSAKFQKGVSLLKGQVMDNSLPAGLMFLELGFGNEDLDIFDDLAWSELDNRMSLAARICREDKLAGIQIRLAPVDSSDFPQFTLFRQPHWADHKRTEYLQMARQRGKEIMAAMVHEDPKLVILLPDFLSDLAPCYDAFGKPSVSPGDSGDLLPAFASGMLDGINGSTSLQVGAPMFGKSRSRGEMLAAAQRCVAFDQQLVDPEVQDRYRARTHPALVVDVLAKGPEQKLEIANALSVTSQYVIIRSTSGDDLHSLAEGLSPTAAERLASSLISGAFTPSNLARLARPLSSEPNRILNGDVVGKIGWDTTAPFGEGQADFDPVKGNNRAGSLHLRALRNACWSQEFGVNARSTYAVRAFCQTNGAARANVEINWKDREGTVLKARTVFLPSEGSGWQPVLGQIQVPETAVKMLLKLTMLAPGGRGDEAWFDDIKVVEL